MDIIISANEKILAITQNKELSQGMTEEEFNEWLNKIVRMENEEEV